MKKMPLVARKEGYILDTHVYPWFAYKGMRFSPIEHVDCYTEDEAEFLEKIALLEKEIEDLKRQGEFKFPDNSEGQS